MQNWHLGLSGILAVMNVKDGSGNGAIFFCSRCIAAADVLLLSGALLLTVVSFRGSWRGQMASTGRDFPAKVWPSAF